MSNRASFLLDASVSSPQLIQLLSSGSTSVLTTIAGGLPKNADDTAVIDLAYRQGATLATTDHGITNKCRHYQTRAGVCLFGLLILPDGIENQRKILQDIRKGKKRLRFSQLDRGLTWSDSRLQLSCTGALARSSTRSGDVRVQSMAGVNITDLQDRQYLLSRNRVIRRLDLSK